MSPRIIACISDSTQPDRVFDDCSAEAAVSSTTFRVPSTLIPGTTEPFNGYILRYSGSNLAPYHILSVRSYDGIPLACAPRWVRSNSKFRRNGPTTLQARPIPSRPTGGRSLQPYPAPLFDTAWNRCRHSKMQNGLSCKTCERLSSLFRRQGMLRNNRRVGDYFLRSSILGGEYCRLAPSV